MRPSARPLSEPTAPIPQQASLASNKLLSSNLGSQAAFQKLDFLPPPRRPAFRTTPSFPPRQKEAEAAPTTQASAIMAALNKIAYNSPSRQNPSELETTIAGALFDLENNTTDLKASLRPLQFASAREVRVSFLDNSFDYLFLCLCFEINWVIRVLIWSVYEIYRGKRGDF